MIFRIIWIRYLLLLARIKALEIKFGIGSLRLEIVLSKMQVLKEWLMGMKPRGVTKNASDRLKSNLIKDVIGWL